MDVFVIPLGRDRYELYCETSAPIAVADARDTSTGWVARMRVRFATMVREAEEREAAGKEGVPVHAPDAGWWDRIQHQSLAWVAERVAEQRLLWNLRNQTAAVIVHPADLTFDAALALVKGMLKRDGDRHVRWLIIDGLLAAVLGPLLFFVPGPNLVAYYFVFRAFGHLLSMRGTSQGLNRVAWSGRAEPRLVDLRHSVLRPGGASAAEVQAIAASLGLSKLAAFVERLATR